MDTILAVWTWFTASFQSTWYWVTAFFVWWAIMWFEAHIQGGSPHTLKEHLLEPFDYLWSTLICDGYWLGALWTTVMYFFLWPLTTALIVAILFILNPLYATYEWVQKMLGLGAR